jgi:C1A family cysteine protease
MHPLKIAALIISVGLGVITYQQVVAPAVTHQSSNNLNELWTAWKAQFGKTYATPQEDQLRMNIFASNQLRVQVHNADPEYTYKLALNQFADLTGEEFRATYASCTGSAGSGAAPDCPSAVNCPTLPTANVTHVNWTNTGAVTPVKNQEQCGSCWAFSTTGSLEGLYYLNHSVLLSFSEQQLVDCAQNCYGCDGCWPYLAMEYTAQNGIELEKVYPYNGEQGNCKYTPSLALSVNTGYQCIQQKSVSQMLSALVQQPVSIAVEADQNAWQLYSHGIVNRGCGDALDHAVLITGYDNTENSWYVKNSWGTSWGMNGYIWISAEPKANSGYGVCGILSCGNIPLNN